MKLATLIDDYIEEEHQLGQMDRTGAIHPSSLSCPRQVWYEYHGYEPDTKFSTRTLRAFKMGFLVEELVTDAVEYSGNLIADQMPLCIFVEGVPVMGTADIVQKVNGGYAIADAKSVHVKAFRYGTMPYQHHRVQVGSYEYMLQETLAMDGDMLQRMMDTISRHAKEPWEAADYHHYRVLIKKLREGDFGPMQVGIMYYLSFVSTYELEAKVTRIELQDRTEAEVIIADMAQYIAQEKIPDRPFATDKKHPYLCTRKGQGGREPSCKWYHKCWEKPVHQELFPEEEWE